MYLFSIPEDVCTSVLTGKTMAEVVRSEERVTILRSAEVLRMMT